LARGAVGQNRRGDTAATWVIDTLKSNVAAFWSQAMTPIKPQRCPHLVRLTVRSGTHSLQQQRGAQRVCAGLRLHLDNMLRVFDYNPNLWPSTVEKDIPLLEDHIKGTWERRDSTDTFMKILLRSSNQST
jgi:hypothetical protein